MDMKEELEGRYFKWLMETGQEADAGALKEKAGQIAEAVKLYQTSGRIVQAARVVMDHSGKTQSLFSTTLIESILKDLKDSAFHMEAGQFYEKVMRDSSAALECYIKAKAFDKAIELARKEFPDEVVNLESKYGEYLMSEVRDPAAAVSHLIEAGKTLRALEAAIQANQFDRAAEISSVLDKVPPAYGKQIADYYANRNDMDAAMEVLISCGLIKDALALLNNKGQYSRSFKLARKFLSQEEAVDLMLGIASQMEEEAKYKEAEKVYLTINDTDAAITMYKNIDRHDDVIRLIKQYHPDLLNDTHIHLAKELVSKGKLVEAEAHFLSANDWKSVVQMYKNSEKWEDAYRVARSYGGAGVAKQVAFMWAESLGNADAAVRLLTRIGLLHQVIDFAIETTSFEFAHDLVTAAGPDLKFKMNEIKFKNALYQEKEGRLQEAEQLFLQASRAKEAVRMYVHANAFPDAIRVTENYISDESALSDVLVAQAKYMLETGGQDPDNLNRVEAVLLRAGRIEAAVKMYKEKRMWEDTFRVADQYAPHLLDSLKREMSSKERGTSEFDGFTPFASRRNSRISRRTSSVSGRASSHLTDDGSDMDESPGTSANGSGGGNVFKMLQKAEQTGDREKVTKYALMSATQLVKDKNPIEALKVLQDSAGPAVSVPEYRKILSRVAKEIFSFDHHPNPDLIVFKNLRDALLPVVAASSASPDEATERLLLIAHYLVVKSVLTSLKQTHPSSLDLLSKVTISLLRYTDVIRVDKAFYEAGQIAKETNKLDMAFVFWNHFLDLTEAIEESDMNVDHSDFDNTDIPAEVPLPQFPFYRDDALVDQVKSWILSVSMESNSSHLSRKLPACPYRDAADVYEASLTSDHSSPPLLPCIVTGYPVIKHKMMELQTARYAANKDDWNKLLMLTKMSASEDLKDILLFIGRLCGNASVARFSFQ
jgi:tetratricopeptide (TPR) repeat protein